MHRSALGVRLALVGLPSLETNEERPQASFLETGCTFSTPLIRALVKEFDPTNATLKAVDNINFLEFQGM
ncbi:hypothetical protein BD311DRAFT_811749 [Dichomitus squalens]|uniref:Uncharacterized protein n=1 Tax=Dichomitus squalens TaxID=114155 RepID=A0A4Q9M7N4_9APHY|nr:hypothetical protein BD311DRAFT_811749 [Dichomitus squalens]